MIRTTRLVTIPSHIQQEEELHPEATGTFSSLMQDLTLALRIIAWEVRRAGLNDILGLTNNKNYNGDIVRKLDDYSNSVIIRAMDHGGNICVMASEESDGLIPIPEKYVKGKYVLVFDPLDGSTNIDVNITIGTIFSIYQRIDPDSKADGTLEDILQPGHKQVAAGYVLYGSSTTLVYTSGHGTHVFTYDPTIGEFIMTFENLRIPNRGKLYSCNEGNFYKWNNQRIRDFVTYLKTPSEDGERPYNLRYIATSVADIHRTIYYGGIYLYPEDSSSPKGKIRLVYEANPLAMIIEQAGGKAISGTQRLMDIVPEHIHQRVPFFVGSKDDVTDLESFLRNGKL
jgi:fructose-1,6-bisphosphatase I